MSNASKQPECLTMTVSDVAVILGISKGAAYTFVEEAMRDGSGIKVLRIGKSLRIIKRSFYETLFGSSESEGA